MGVVGALELAISLRRDDGFGSRFSDPVAQVVGIITLVGDRGADLEAVDKFMCEGNVVTLAGAGDQTDRIAERIAGGMDLGAQPAARPAQALGIRPPFDWRAPAACWCARTMVLSIISHSRSASRESTARISSRTPIAIQR